MNGKIDILMPADEMLVAELTVDDQRGQQCNPEADRKPEDADGRIEPVAREMTQGGKQDVLQHEVSPKRLSATAGIPAECME